MSSFADLTEVNALKANIAPEVSSRVSPRHPLRMLKNKSAPIVNRSLSLGAVVIHIWMWHNFLPLNMTYTFPYPFPRPGHEGTRDLGTLE
ncbi:hypothetical protein BKA82DRAFT_621655 [Pisolithus tinctorius]|uniref:Uncharacterized protein n=1 Tax=Pisolithus tinctorius Marx 270 TaxID=870435 RepID=A0A0C3J335_PISTI|nr:hypothetical protein BKA82DRAFT_621655 [Pisolithus tinctorius]KIO03488.1 hypothetical protein M404DRAFT_621655 [Pisolithus tinctorius Marx 270]